MKNPNSLFAPPFSLTPPNPKSVWLALAIVASIASLIAPRLEAQTGPFPPTSWPASINSNSVVDYCILDPNASFNSPPGWNNVLSLAGGGDQTFSSVTLGGLIGDQTTSTYLNVADPNFASFAQVPVIDILMQVYGNSFLYTSTGAGVNVSFLEGQLNHLNGASAGVFPPGGDNAQWNWVLFEITNAIDSKTGQRYVGDTSFGTMTGGQFGGVNSGTLRWQGIGSGVAVRAIAIGPQGAFGTTNQVNVFASGSVCAPEPQVNLAWVDFNQKVTNHLIVLSNLNLGETFALQTGVGPSNDLRTAIQATSGLMNFGILSNYLGLPCNTPREVELAVEFYDDPNLGFGSFGPAQFATDAQGDLGAYAGSAYSLTGTGKWLRVAFFIPSVDLEGVNTSPLTGGPTLSFVGSAPFIDRIELGVVRAGTNTLAGQIPDPTYFMNPIICETNYGYYAEWDPQDGITNNLTIGSSGADQNMVVQLAGPTNDMRLAEAPAPGSGNIYIQFALLNAALGPSLQDNAHVAMELTYYDDPALAGAQIGPNAYQTYVGGVSAIVGNPPPPYNVTATLQGTGKWLDAYFELPAVNFNGVNQGPQAIVRFSTTPPPGTNTPASIFVSRARFDVIRPCGPFQGINMLQSPSIATDSNANVNVSWFGTATVQSSASLSAPFKNSFTITNTSTNTYSVPPTNNAQFFRLQFPPYPDYLSTNPIFSTP